MQYAADNGIIDLRQVCEQYAMQKDKKYLRMHEYDIWQTNKGIWKTYIIKPTGKRAIVERKNREDLEAMLIAHYKSLEESPTLKKVFDSWSGDKLKYGEVSKGTIDRYTNDFNRFFGKIQNTQIGSLTEGDLKAFIKTTIKEKELSAKGYAGMRTIMIGMFLYALDYDYTDIDIVGFFQRLRISKSSFTKKIKTKEEEIFTQEEIKMLCFFIDEDPTIRNLGLKLDIQTGLRVGELAALKRSDINLKEKYIHIQRTEIRYKGEDGVSHPEVREYPKSAAGDRYLLLTEGAIDTIKKLDKINPFGEYLFMDKGKRITENGWAHAIRRLCDRTRIPRRSMHKIRRTYGTTLIDAGVDEAFIVEQMGHEDITTTRKFYYYSNKDKESHLEQLNEAIHF